MNEIVKSDDCFFVATGITDGMIINGLRKQQNGLMLTHSFFTASGMLDRYQFIETYHSLYK